MRLLVVPSLPGPVFAAVTVMTVAVGRALAAAGLDALADRLVPRRELAPIYATPHRGRAAGHRHRPRRR